MSPLVRWTQRKVVIPLQLQNSLVRIRVGMMVASCSPFLRSPRYPNQMSRFSLSGYRSSSTMDPSCEAYSGLVGPNPRKLSRTSPRLGMSILWSDSRKLAWELIVSLQVGSIDLPRLVSLVNLAPNSNVPL